MNWDDAPRVFFQRTQRIGKTVKPHRCCDCGQEIPAGSAAWKFVQMTDEDNKPAVYYSHRHPVSHYPCGEEEYNGSQTV